MAQGQITLQWLLTSVDHLEVHYTAASGGGSDTINLTTTGGTGRYYADESGLTSDLLQAFETELNAQAVGSWQVEYVSSGQKGIWRITQTPAASKVAEWIDFLTSEVGYADLGFAQGASVHPDSGSARPSTDSISLVVSGLDRVRSGQYQGRRLWYPRTETVDNRPWDMRWNTGTLARATGIGLLDHHGKYTMHRLVWGAVPAGIVHTWAAADSGYLARVVDVTVAGDPNMAFDQFWGDLTDILDPSDPQPPVFRWAPDEDSPATYTELQCPFSTLLETLDPESGGSVLTTQERNPLTYTVALKAVTSVAT